MKVGLLLCTYNRFALLRECLDSLAKLTEIPDYFIIVDDCSTDPEMIPYLDELKSFYMGSAPDCSVFLKNENKGIKHSLFCGYGRLFDFTDCDVVVNLDADAIVKPNFITELKRLKQLYPKHIISGFNCNHPQNPVLIDKEDHVFRKHCNGINMCIDKEQYETIVRPALLSPGNWDYQSTHNLSFVIAKPSLVQHLGANDSTMGHVGGDVACDF